MTILVIGGTARARSIASRLARRHDVIYSLAGVTDNPLLPSGCRLRSGGFGGVEGLGRFLVAETIERVIDASHPHADGISANADAATAAHGIPLSRLQWRLWQPEESDRWRSFTSTEAMARALAVRSPSRVFLALGAKASQPFLNIDGHALWLRCVQPPDIEHTTSPVALIQSRGPFTLADELQLLTSNRIDLLVCKNSGLPQGRAKLDAARVVGIEVWLLEPGP